MFEVSNCVEMEKYEDEEISEFSGLSAAYRLMVIENLHEAFRVFKYQVVPLGFPGESS